ncbi:conserved protein of unknown function [Microbacterium sp. Nx66]|uniref:hypothetical protein n=1 Tax=unclassified Microbacterium TaxID=2609290 RepID=UPI001656C281|nr:hypothetical protein [Microbacterium sp. Nx66]CAD5139016.1 conserved protein of unknown function [Microbacterium sp. Nx66]
MTTDPLDDLLDGSAPPTPAVAGHELRAMIDASRGRARPRLRSRGVIAAVTAVVLVGGAGVATASSDWLWGDGLEDPARSYRFTAPTWGECEIRFSRLDTHNPLIQADVDRVIDQWFASADVEAEAAPYVDGQLRMLEQGDEAAGVPTTDQNAADTRAWMAHEGALNEALHAELEEHGFGPIPGADSHSQVHCDDEAWSGE